MNIIKRNLKMETTSKTETTWKKGPEKKDTPRSTKRKMTKGRQLCKGAVKIMSQKVEQDLVFSAKLQIKEN